MRYLPTVVLLATIAATPVAAQQLLRPIRISETVSNSVVIDGVFDADEWEGAVIVPRSDPCEMHVKRQNGQLFLGVRCPDLSLPILDLFLSPDGADIYQLHISSYLAERVLDSDRTVESYWQSGLHLDWTANQVQWDATAAEGLRKRGISGQEMLRRAVRPYDGFEVRIREDQFESSFWRVRVEVSQFAVSHTPIVLPANDGHAADSDSWYIIHLSSESVTSRAIR